MNQLHKQTSRVSRDRLKCGGASAIGLWRTRIGDAAPLNVSYEQRPVPV